MIQCLPPDRYVLRFCGKLSTKNTTKFENSSDRYGFLTNYYMNRSDLMVGTV